MEKTKACKDFESFLKKIGGLESGYRQIYHGDNPVRKFLFNVFDYFRWKMPSDKRPRNPFRSKIVDRYFFEVGDGWLPLMQSLITEAIDKGWNREICQVKQKYASLRFYTNGITKEVGDVISKYEHIAGDTCEVCGEPGKMRPGGWIEVLCDEHSKQKK
jgi:hypothetical protein